MAAGLGWSIVPTSSMRGSRLGIVAEELLGLTDRIVIGAALREEEDDPAVLSLLDIAQKHLTSPQSGLHLLREGRVDSKL